MVKRPAPEFFSRRVIQKNLVTPGNSVGQMSLRRNEARTVGIDRDDRVDAIIINPLLSEPIVLEDVGVSRFMLNVSDKLLSVGDDMVRVVQLVAWPSDAGYSTSATRVSRLENFLLNRAIFKSPAQLDATSAHTTAAIPKLEAELAGLDVADKARVIAIKLEENELRASSVFRANITHDQDRHIMRIPAARSKLLGLSQGDMVQFIARPARIDL